VPLVAGIILVERKTHFVRPEMMMLENNIGKIRTTLVLSESRRNARQQSIIRTRRRRIWGVLITARQMRRIIPVTTFHFFRLTDRRWKSSLLLACQCTVYTARTTPAKLKPRFKSRPPFAILMLTLFECG